VADIFPIIQTRRSIRRFLAQRIPSHIIRQLAEAARWAPSAHNAQPWRFVVFQKKAAKEKLAQAMARTFQGDLKKDRVPPAIAQAKTQESIQRITAAPLCLLVCMSKEGSRFYPDQRRRGLEEKMVFQGVGAAIQNILLAAHSLGLGACWLSAPLFCPGTVRRALKLPKGWAPMALILLGYPADNPKAPERIPLKKMIRWIRGGKGKGG
jgi:coenzyme F420-0:L-glutamate ligase / coenzyme F420-1:gamma-L-glutamate ligase